MNVHRWERKIFLARVSPGNLKNRGELRFMCVVVDNQARHSQGQHWSHLRPCYWNVHYIAWPWEANARCLEGSDATRPDSAPGNSQRGRVAGAPFRRFFSFLMCWCLERFNAVSCAVFIPLLLPILNRTEMAGWHPWHTPAGVKRYAVLCL